MGLAELREYLDEERKVMDVIPKEGFTYAQFIGGEPFIHLDLLKEGIKHAKQIGLGANIITNSFWATSEELALRRLRQLKEIGLDRLALSVDPFHCDYVPLDHVRNAFRAAKSLGMYVAIPGSCYFDEKDGDYSLRRSREIVTRFSPLAEIAADAWHISLQGTANDTFSERAPRHSWTWEGFFSGCFMVHTRFHGLDSAAVESYGHVIPGPCWGISIGNAQDKKLSEIITTYDPQSHPILGPVYDEGPAGVARLAMEYGFEPTEYISPCHLCTEARRALLDHYPEHLGPAIWYERVKTKGENAAGTMDITKSGDYGKVSSIYMLGNQFARSDDREKILDSLLISARDPDANVRRASLFSLVDCISDDTRVRIVGVFEDLLADETKTVKYAALEVLTEALPHSIREGTLDRILGFLEADEVSIRWQAILAIDKAYPDLNAEDRDTAVGVLSQAIDSEDIFVKVRAYQALSNIRDSEKRSFPEVDAALERESDFVQWWAHYNDDIR